MSKVPPGLTYDQWYYITVRKHRHRPSRRADPNAKCEFCGVFLSSKFGTKRGRKYCDDCRSNKKLQRKLMAKYQLDAYYRRVAKQRECV